MQVERLGLDDRDDVVEVLALAFVDYPVFRFVLRGSEGSTFQAHIRHLIGYYADSRLLRGWPVLGIREKGRLVAAALVSDPVRTPAPESLQASFRRVSAIIGPDAIERMDRFESILDPYLPEFATYFVGMLGVVPDRRGAGYGRALMEQVAQMATDRDEAHGVTLSTEDPGNLSFYQHLGYRILGKADLRDLTTWLLVRETPSR